MGQADQSMYKGPEARESIAVWRNCRMFSVVGVQHSQGKVGGELRLERVAGS